MDCLLLGRVGNGCSSLDFGDEVGAGEVGFLVCPAAVGDTEYGGVEVCFVDVDDVPELGGGDMGEVWAE